MDEFGTAIRLSDRLAHKGYTALRFSFRGHGASAGHQRGTTIADDAITAAVAWLTRR